MLKRKLITGIATGALLLNAFAPLAFADTTIVVTGNGTDSNNTANVTTSQNVTVMQSNDANVTNNVTSDAKTGSNEANRNTGGNVTIDTGNANSTVNVSTKANVNSADTGCTTCGTGNTTVTVSGNGDNSTNNATVNTGKNSGTQVFQENEADVHNYVDSDAKTGDNEAERNTGGDVTIRTGNAASNTTVNNTVNANLATVGGGTGGNSVSAQISGNGVDSHNGIKLTVGNSVGIWQSNDAYIDNHVESDAKTGGNEAEHNTGGNVTIDTGSAKADTTVSNMANFNAADVDCGCVLGGDVLAKIATNGDGSKNSISATLGGGIGVYQGGKGEVGELGNEADVHNDVNSDAKTGYNEAESNTGAESGISDPSIYTGDATSTTDVSTSANANFFGPLGDFEMPDFSGLHLDFNFSLGDLLGSLHLG